MPWPGEPLLHQSGGGAGGLLARWRGGALGEYSTSGGAKRRPMTYHLLLELLIWVVTLNCTRRSATGDGGKKHGLEDAPLCM